MSLTASAYTPAFGHWAGPYFRTAGASNTPIKYHKWDSASSAEGIAFNFTTSLLNTTLSPPGATNQVYPFETFEAPALTMVGTMQPYWVWVTDSGSQTLYTPTETCKADADITGDYNGSITIQGSFFPGQNAGVANPNDQAVNAEENYTYLCTLGGGADGLEAEGDTLTFSLFDPSIVQNDTLPNTYSVAGFLSVTASVN